MRAADENLSAYEALLIRLHELNAAGDNREATRDVCDNMAALEDGFGPADVAFLNGLSSDLYMRVDREVYAADRDAAAMSPTRRAAQLNRALLQGEWVTLLHLLRSGPPPNPLRPDQVAYLRSKAYGGLGHPVPATVFMAEAFRRRPGQANYLALLLSLLQAHGNDGEAVALASSILDDAGSPPRAAIMAAAAICRQLALGGPAPQLGLIRRAVARLPTDLGGETLPRVLFVGYLALGMFQRSLRDERGAADAFGRALASQDLLPAQSLAYALAQRERDLLGQGRLGSAEEQDVAGSLMAAVPGDYAWAE